MKPHDLKSPFTWNQRHVTIHDRVWYVPGKYNDFQSFSFPGWEHPNLFGRNAPICIEYCSGNGAWIAAKAQSEPETNWVAVEMKFERVRKIWSKIKNHQLNNLLVVCGEGFKVTHHYFPSSSVKAVYINFPDPWPKRRHGKHRIVQPSFMSEIHRVLEPKGSVTLATDDESYSRSMIDVLMKVPGFQSELPAPYYTHDFPDYGTSYFEDLWREKGKSIHYHLFSKEMTHE